MNVHLYTSVFHQYRPCFILEEQTIFYSVSIRQKTSAYYFVILTAIEEDCLHRIFNVNMVYVTLGVIHKVIFESNI